MKKIKIYDFEVIDRCLFWKENRTLIVGDLHLGYEQTLGERGLAVFMNQLKQTVEIFDRIFKRIGKVKRIILLGDVKHYFGGVLKQELRDFEKLILYLKNNLNENGRIVITKGNHDNILEPITKIYPEVVLLDNFFEEDVLFIHGDSQSVKRSYDLIKNKKVKIVVLGHFHPTYLLKDKKSIKQEKYKCFLYGHSKEYGKNVIFVPSFFPLIEGSDVISESVICERGMKTVLVADDGKIYDFGRA